MTLRVSSYTPLAFARSLILILLAEGHKRKAAIPNRSHTVPRLGLKMQVISEVREANGHI